MHTYTHTHLHTYTHAFVYTYTHSYVHTHTHPQILAGVVMVRQNLARPRTGTGAGRGVTRKVGRTGIGKIGDWV